MANKNKLKSHNKNKNHNHNEIHIHMTDKKTKPRRRKKTTRKPRDAPVPYQTFQPAPVLIYTNRPQFLETTTQSQRENPIHSTVRVNEQISVFSDSTPIQSRTFSDALPYLTPKSEYTPQVKVEQMTPLYSKSSFEEPYKPFWTIHRFNPHCHSRKIFRRHLHFEVRLREQLSIIRKVVMNQTIRLKHQMSQQYP